ncbi:portal protein [Selenomonas sp. TAMA-11512]|uniref:portal protein n=1 Tax=Selenomonas sp. TAMA-11512 TaxID=3095337 RepID=UPI003093C9D2|nr:portal protein [Selenomonas sp. TAMA-11512]
MQEQNKNGARLPPLIRASYLAARLSIRRKTIERSVKQLLEKRGTYEKRWEEIRSYQLPYLGSFDGVDDETNAGNRKDGNVWHNCAWDCNQIFAAGVMGGLTPPSRKWFRLNFANTELEDNSNLGKILDERIDILADVLEKSNFYTAVHSCYLELAFGQAPLGIFPDRQYGVHFVPYPIGSYAMENGADGTIQTFCRRYKMSAQQLVDKFGEENVPDNIRAELSNGPGIKATHTVVWYVDKNRNHDPKKLGSAYLPYISVYYMEGSAEDEFLHIGGFHEWPVPVARYLITGNDSYGKGPGWFAEGDAKILHLLEKDKLTVVELGVKPPVVVDDSLATKGINLVPSGKTFVQQKDAITPLFQVQVNLEHLLTVVEDVTTRIKRAYSADLFLMLDQQDKSMTAREVLERTQEKMNILGPVVQRMQFEFLGRIIERVYNILDRERMFPEPEDEEAAEMLRNQELKIEYISPLAQAQKMSGLVNIEQAVAFIAQMAQFHPDILDKMDWNETANRYISMVGAPAAIKRTDDEYAAIQQQKQEMAAQQQEMQQAAQMAQMAAPAAQAAKNATEAAQDGNPAMQQLLGMHMVG